MLASDQHPANASWGQWAIAQRVLVLLPPTWETGLETLAWHSLGCGMHWQGRTGGGEQMEDLSFLCHSTFQADENKHFFKELRFMLLTALFSSRAGEHPAHWQ